ncbi:hypothetical protein GYMLUDRAFT_60344 [Collybiopsis luxurians FD-317 M1]|uniref:Uncharacterized protein n=1 Tax=Collybiopsis luxurians FD-317 M1 TaxID=944289 RepID=A0A0D0CTN2_9AGAR|nr:hypothetical protein GYMLUDRAFT_60344 [Collybiopsis luxurians FD-317 M1]
MEQLSQSINLPKKQHASIYSLCYCYRPSLALNECIFNLLLVPTYRFNKTHEGGAALQRCVYNTTISNSLIMTFSREEKSPTSTTTSLQNPLSMIPRSKSANQLTTLIESVLDYDNRTPHIIYDDILSRIRQCSHDNPIQHTLVLLLSAIK